jgi:transposase
MSTDFTAIEALLDVPELRIVELRLMPREVFIVLESREPTCLCPRCGHPCLPTGEKPRTRTLRDLPILQRYTRLVVRIRRFVCRSCSLRFRERLALLAGHQRWTQRLYEQVRAELLHGTPTQELARRYGVARRTIFRWTFERGRGGRPRQRGTVMGMDAFSVKKGQVSDTHIVDLQRHRTITVLEGRSKDAVVAWLRSHTAEALAAVEVVVTDMSSVYAAAVREVFGERVLVIDRFHVITLAVEALEEVRRMMQKQLSPEEATQRKKMRRLWLKPARDLTIEQWLARLTWLERFPPFKEILQWVQELRGWFDRRYPKPARAALERLIAKAQASAIAGLHEMAGTLVRWKESLVNFIRHRFTNGMVEGFNTKIKLIQRMAYGLRNPNNRRKRIQAWCGAA